MAGLLLTLLIANNVTLELVPDKRVYAVGEPIRVELRWHNGSTRTAKVEQGYSFFCGSPLRARTERGAPVPNPYDIDLLCGSFPFTEHPMKPDERATTKYVLNESARLDRPGVYVVAAPHARYTVGRTQRRPRVVTARIEIVRMDPQQRANTIARLKWKGDLRRLAFFHDAALIPFFLDALERKKSLAFWSLLGVPNRAAVVQAFEARLDGCGRKRFDRLIQAYVDLAAPDDFAAHHNLREKYRPRR